jgi:hypothetical protein
MKPHFSSTKKCGKEREGHAAPKPRRQPRQRWLALPIFRPGRGLRAQPGFSGMRRERRRSLPACAPRQQRRVPENSNLFDLPQKQLSLGR